MSRDHPEGTNATRPETAEPPRTVVPEPSRRMAETGTSAHQTTGATYPVTATTPPTDPKEHIRLTGLKIARTIRISFARIRE